MPAYAKVEKTPSLKDTLNKIDTIGKADSKSTNGQAAIKTQENIPHDDFTQQQLDEQWELFVERLKKSDTRMFVALRSIKPVLLEKDKVELVFQNSAQIEEYRMRLKPQLISKLKETFNNHFIELVEQLAESENMVKPNLLSDKEMLGKMVEKNPALDNLRKKFNLDFD